MFYKEDKGGQILQEGINEAGAFSSWIASGDVVLQPRRSRPSRSTSTTRCSASSGSATSPGPPATTARAGSCSAAPPGARRSTARGSSTRTATRHLLSSTIPNCVSYDPTYGYEVAVIVHEGLRRMVGEQEDVFYYLTLMNENYPHPAMPEGAEEGILRGIHRICSAEGARRPAARARARSCARSRPPRSCCARTSASTPASGASPASPSSRATAWRPSAGTCCTRASSARVPYVAQRAPRRARRRGHGLHARVRRADPRRTSPARTRCSAPTATGAATGAGCCASSSRSTAATSTLAALRAVARAGPTRSTAQEAIESYEIDAEVAPPWRR